MGTNEATTGDLLEGIAAWVAIESQTDDVEGVNRMMSRAAEDFAAAGGRVTRIPGKAGRGDLWPSIRLGAAMGRAFWS